MTTMTRFVPFRSGFEDVAELQTRLNRLFEGVTRNGETAGNGSFVPPVDIYEDKDHLLLKLEIPGVSSENLDIRVENQTLTVKGQRHLEPEHKEENYHRLERRFGSFTRSFTLPQTIDTGAVEAGYQDGVLTITFSKKPESKPRRIQVKVGASGSAQIAGDAVQGGTMETAPTA